MYPRLSAIFDTYDPSEYENQVVEDVLEMNCVELFWEYASALGLRLLEPQYRLEQCFRGARDYYEDRRVDCYHPHRYDRNNCLARIERDREADEAACEAAFLEEYNRIVSGDYIRWILDIAEASACTWFNQIVAPDVAPLVED